MQQRECRSFYWHCRDLILEEMIKRADLAKFLCMADHSVNLETESLNPRKAKPNRPLDGDIFSNNKMSAKMIDTKLYHTTNSISSFSLLITEHMPLNGLNVTKITFGYAIRFGTILHIYISTLLSQPGIQNPPVWRSLIISCTMRLPLSNANALKIFEVLIARSVMPQNCDSISISTLSDQSRGGI